MNCVKIVPEHFITPVGDLIECRGEGEYKDYSACTFDDLSREEYEEWQEKKQ